MTPTADYGAEYFWARRAVACAIEGRQLVVTPEEYEELSHLNWAYFDKAVVTVMIEDREFPFTPMPPVMVRVATREQQVEEVRESLRRSFLGRSLGSWGFDAGSLVDVWIGR